MQTEPRPGVGGVSWTTIGAAIAICAGAAFVEGYVLTHNFPNALGPRADASFGVLEGTPHWRAYQNRLLGPFLVRVIQVVSGATRDQSMQTFYWVAVFAKAAVAFTLFRRVSGRWVSPAVYSAAVSGLSILCFWQFVYPWDYLEAILLSLFLLFVAVGGRWLWFGALFVLALANRESVVYLPLWLAIDSVTILPKKRWGRIEVDLRKLILAIGLVALSLVIIYWLREALFVRATQPIADPDDQVHGAFANHFVLGRNIKRIFTGFGTFGPGDVSLLISLGFLLLLGSSWLRARRLSTKGRKLLFWTTCVALNLLTFAIIREARIWIGVIPIWVFWLAVFRGDVLGRLGLYATPSAGAPSPSS